MGMNDIPAETDWVYEQVKDAQTDQSIRESMKRGELIHARVFWTTIPSSSLAPDYDSLMAPAAAIAEFGEPTRKHVHDDGTQEWTWE